MFGSTKNFKSYILFCGIISPIFNVSMHKIQSNQVFVNETFK